MAEWTGLEPATPGVTGRYSNRLNYHSARGKRCESAHHSTLSHPTQALFEQHVSFDALTPCDIRSKLTQGSAHAVDPAGHTLSIYT
jgi:hypothetical protein